MKEWCSVSVPMVRVVIIVSQGKGHSKGKDFNQGEGPYQGTYEGPCQG